jgi:hypothetical protein
VNTTPKYFLYINGVRFEVDLPKLRQVQVRALAGIPPEHSLVVERNDARADILFQEDDEISLSEGPVHIYSRPPTMFGAPLLLNDYA